MFACICERHSNTKILYTHYTSTIYIRYSANFIKIVNEMIRWISFISLDVCSYTLQITKCYLCQNMYLLHALKFWRWIDILFRFYCEMRIYKMVLMSSAHVVPFVREKHQHCQWDRKNIRTSDDDQIYIFQFCRLAKRRRFGNFPYAHYVHLSIVCTVECRDNNTHRNNFYRK